MDNGPILGSLIADESARRDAFHVAVAPVISSERLMPGQHVGLVDDGRVDRVAPGADPVGIVDPFLTEPVEPGQRFWLLLYPGSTESLRHIWTHPRFSAAAAKFQERLILPEFQIREKFKAALFENEDNREVRAAFADWLDERGEHEEAQRHRDWQEARTWLIEFCHKYRNYCGDGPDMTLEALIAIANEGYRRWKNEPGRNPNLSMFLGAYESLCDALRGPEGPTFWKYWAIATGRYVSGGEATKATYGCGC